MPPPGVHACGCHSPLGLPFCAFAHGSSSLGGTSGCFGSAAGRLLAPGLVKTLAATPPCTRVRSGSLSKGPIFPTVVSALLCTSSGLGCGCSLPASTFLDVLLLLSNCGCVWLRLGESKKDSFAFHLASASAARTFNCRCRIKSWDCSVREGGFSRVCRSHWCHAGVILDVTSLYWRERGYSTMRRMRPGLRVSRNSQNVLPWRSSPAVC